MQVLPNHAHLHPILSYADRAADRLCRQHAGPRLEHDDVRQDLLLDLLTRLKGFDPARSSLPTFAAICFRHRATHLGILSGRERRGRHPAALDAPLPDGEGLILLDTISNGDGYGAWIGQSIDRHGASEQRLDFDRALSLLGPDAIPLCAALLEPPQVAQTLSRTTAHRRVHELRLQLLALGVGHHRETNCRGGE